MGQCLKDHIQLAIALHDIHDVYIFEHEHCGAYSKLLDKSKVDLSTKEAEIKCHKDFSKEFGKRIVKEYEEHEINAHAFFMDLRGNVKLLWSNTTKKKTPLQFT